MHLGGAFHCCQAAIPHMMRRGGGAIVNMLTSVFRAANPRHQAYGPAKAALRNFTMNLAAEMGPHGIRANSVSPSTTETEEFPTRITGEERDRRRRENPLGRLATPEDVCGAVVFLCTDAARYITGADLIVSGGGLISL
jgi:3-oxoacyl-[acyl-carrier protein] reductase